VLKYRELYELGKDRLAAAGIAEAELDARLLLEAVCGTGKHDLLVNGEREVTDECEECYVNHIARREKRMPLQYILGEQEFMGLKFLVTPDVLIPRQDSETLVEAVMRHLQDGQAILDLGTGSGCILLSLLHYSNECRGTGVDISADALKVAAANEERIRLLPRAGVPPLKTVTWIQSDLFDKVNDRFDIIVANPPYIPTAEIARLMPEVRDHEPRPALDGKADGYYFYQKIIDQSSQYLCPGGFLFLEIGYNQADAVKTMMAAADFVNTNVINDLTGNNRVVYGERPVVLGGYDV
jgi:release factor glutamine methyltransferase